MSKTLRHPWLDEDDPANSKLPGFWVPSHDEIDYACELARAEHVKAMKRSGGGVDERRFYRPPKQATLFNLRKESEESKLCDCPYWGTEFETED